MFVTLVVALPSGFTSGGIHVSHSGGEGVFDNVKDSAFETMILAWYADPTPGYRFVLPYHSINTSPGVTSPHPPSGDSNLQRLREISASVPTTSTLP